MVSVSQPDFLKTWNYRRQCFHELLALSRQQFRLIEADDYQQLLSVLGNKQRLIGRLEELGKLQPQIFQEWKIHRDSLPAAERQACEDALEQTEDILSQLLEEERICTEFVARRRSETQIEIRGVTVGAHAHQAYGDSLAPATYRHLDIDQ